MHEFNFVPAASAKVPCKHVGYVVLRQLPSALAKLAVSISVRYMYHVVKAAVMIIGPQDETIATHVYFCSVSATRSGTTFKA